MYSILLNIIISTKYLSSLKIRHPSKFLIVQVVTHKVTVEGLGRGVKSFLGQTLYPTNFRTNRTPNRRSSFVHDDRNYLYDSGEGG